MKATLPIILMAALAAALSCGPGGGENGAEEPTPEVQAQPAAPERAEDFEEFYAKFYSDSVFQKSRVRFPLPGFRLSEHHPDSVASDTNYYWDKSAWRFRHTIEGDSLVFDEIIYKKEMHYSDREVLEQIYIQDAGYFVENKFKMINGGWYLVFIYDATSW